jgi:DMSO/TMAO reductase YedYZ molybdopterin-dependent catalytic subunit
LAGRILRGQSDSAELPTVQLPFGNGGRELVAYPQKRPLLRLTARPPQLETPWEVFRYGVITPNDAFFVRYHLAGIPTQIDPATYRIRIKGAVERPLELSLDELKRLAPPQTVLAVNQCSGNSRGFFSPRVPGGQIGNGAMGNARWTGVPLRAVLEKAGVKAGAKQVTFEGLDRPILPATPEFVKALDIDQALDGEVMLAYQMNGEDLPFLNGYPVRLVVPGYFGTYWVKHLADITVVDKTFAGFWMASAYRVPDNPTHSVAPGTTPAKTIPIGRFPVRSFCTSLENGDKLASDSNAPLRGIAFDGGSGIKAVRTSIDQGRSWQAAQLGEDLGRYSFREWFGLIRPPAGPGELWVRAEANNGDLQPLEQRWNPSGYMRTVVEKLAFVAGMLVLGFLGAPRARAMQITLPAETAHFAPSTLPGFALAGNYCAICHSADYLRTQPPHLPRAAWTAEVTKMRKVYGAPIPEDAAESIIDYLAKTYGAEAGSETLNTTPLPSVSGSH